LARLSKKKWQRASDLANQYGIEILTEPASYERDFGLWLNLERQQLRDSVSVSVAVQTALSGKIPYSVFRANCDDDESAKKMMDDHESRKILSDAVEDAMRTG